MTPAQAEQLASAVRAGTASLQQANDQLDSLRASAKAALELHATAKQKADDAALAAATAQQRADALRDQAADAQTTLNRIAADAYRGGPLAGRTPGLTALLTSHDPGELLRDVHDVQSLAAEQSSTVASTQQTLDAARQAASAATAASAAAVAAEADEKTKAAQASTLLKAAQQLVDGLAAKLAGTGTGDQLAQALSVAERRERDQQLTRAGALATGIPSSGAAGCDGSDAAAYPNGQIPLSALCPLWGAPGQVLRSDAAAAFDELSKAYAAHFGTPICVTDSYRSLAVQQDLILRKPTLAAIPGTSNHGWGLAVDLCDGVQDFGTPQHVWLDQNAFRFGWFHPAWAEPSGSRPEPWHWEYGGA
ncbi:D-alanyl-D-alanine carboxypeptidase-like protein [Motilibacter rhizosphaerae]|uniref:D-alanyl-D-alanine carboxypeptidase-like protein n=2 Tax=Motilibacter rhizosphaerae TaxID=598652 RepID=A0A4Q7NT43_9ACTN|nr:D-alanyl-D-alanine carboxypeptidase-like protein [Motilibacter rhizosphaerae]